MSTLLSSQTERLANSAVVNHTKQLKNVEKLTRCYQADQQLKYLHLQAEIEVLLQQLQTLKQQNSAQLISQD